MCYHTEPIMPLWEPMARHHASVLVNYLKMHAESAELLAKDPTKRRQLNESEFKSDPNEDVDELLRVWDRALLKVPVTPEDHSNRLHYATSAFIYYQRAKIDPDVLIFGKEFELFIDDRVSEEFDTFLGLHGGSNLNLQKLQLRNTNPAPPPPLAIPNLSVAEIKDLLANTSTLLSTKFYDRDDDDSEFWSVTKITRSETASGTTVKYVVSFEDPKIRVYVVDMEENDVVDLMLRSCTVPSAENVQ